MTLSPLPRRDLIASSSSSARLESHQLRSGMAVLLPAASTRNATPFYGLADPEIIAAALHVICNCVTAPPSLAYLLPASGTVATAAAAAAAVDKALELHQTPVNAELAVGSDHTAPLHLNWAPWPLDTPKYPPPSVFLLRVSWQSSLGEALEAGYAAAQQAVRSSNGIRVLLTVLHSRQHLHLLLRIGWGRWRVVRIWGWLEIFPYGILCSISRSHYRPLTSFRTCLCVLTKFQVGKLLAELVREPMALGGAGTSSSRREANAAAEEAATGTAAGERCKLLK